MRHTPHFESEKFIPKSEMPIKVTNQMQMALMEQHKDPREWVIIYAQKFQEIIEENPELIAEYEEEPEVCIEKLKEMLQKRALH